MRIAFAIVSLFESGGLQRDCVEIARLVGARGHAVTLFTARLDHAGLDDLKIEVLPVAASTNHGRNAEFSARLREAARGRFDCLVGFDKLADLDLLYCADRSIAHRSAPRFYLSLLPRYRTLTRLEGESFAHGRATRVLLLSERQAREYRTAWRTEPERITVLPPSIAPDRAHPEYRSDGTRAYMRGTFGLSPNTLAWLFIGAQPRTKGLDRAIDALTHHPDARLLVAGAKEPGAWSCDGWGLRRSGAAERVVWLGHREDIPRLMAAADLLVHPARYDTTGTVIMEAIANGLPVITTAACGYASHVEQAGAGVVIAEPFSAERFRAALATACADERSRAAWSAGAVAYARRLEPFRGRDIAADRIIAGE